MALIVAAIPDISPPPPAMESTNPARNTRGHIIRYLIIVLPLCFVKSVRILIISNKYGNDTTIFKIFYLHRCNVQCIIKHTFFRRRGNTNEILHIRRNQGS